MNIQDEVIKIHSKYGITEKANYEIQLLTERYAKEYHESEVKKLNIPAVSGLICDSFRVRKNYKSDQTCDRCGKLPWEHEQTCH